MSSGVRKFAEVVHRLGALSIPARPFSGLALAGDFPASLAAQRSGSARPIADGAPSGGRPRLIRLSHNVVWDNERPDESAPAPEPPDRDRRSPSDQRRHWMRWARFGVLPLFVALDLFAVGLAASCLVVIGLGSVGVLEGVRALVFGGVLLFLLFARGLYRSRLSLSMLDDLPIVVGMALFAAVLTGLGQLPWTSGAGRDWSINWRFLCGATAVVVAVVLFRAVGYAAVRHLRTRRLVEHRTLILGAGRVGREVAEILDSHREYGLRPVGFLDSDPPGINYALPLPVLGGPEDLTDVLRTQDVDNVVVAFSSNKESEMVGLIRECDRFRCELFVIPRLFELHHSGRETDNIWGLPLVRLRRAAYRSRTWHLKRATDVVASGFALFILAPILLLISVAVRWDGGPGILFRQERVGVDGRCFELLKFRSYRPATELESATRWAVADDAQLSRIGSFLRRTSLDELPQLINVLRGDMSLVGPRPERPHFVDQFRNLYPSYEARHRVPSGLTGWAQVHGLRGDTSIADRARFDNYYIENWSLWLDVRITLRTLGSVLRGDGR